MKKDNQFTLAIDVINEGLFFKWPKVVKRWNKEDLVATYGQLPSQYYALGGTSGGLKYELKLTKQPQPLDIYTNEDNEIVLFRLEDAVSPQSGAAFMETLGQADTTMTIANGYRFAPAKLYIYASQGIAFYWLAAGPELPYGLLMAVAFYYPTTVEDYLGRLGGVESFKFFEE